MSTPTPTTPTDSYPAGTITLFPGQGTPIAISGVSNINWSAFPACPNLVTFSSGGVTYYSTLPFLYHD